jgi:hypothetical protein
MDVTVYAGTMYSKAKAYLYAMEVIKLMGYEYCCGIIPLSKKQPHSFLFLGVE